MALEFMRLRSFTGSGKGMANGHNDDDEDDDEDDEGEGDIVDDDDVKRKSWSKRVCLSRRQIRRGAAKSAPPAYYY